MQGETQDGEPLRGTPFILMPFHKFIIYNLFGIYRKGTKIKKYHEALIFIPRKNVKTSFSAALAYAVGLLYRKSGSLFKKQFATCKAKHKTENLYEVLLLF